MNSFFRAATICVLLASLSAALSFAQQKDSALEKQVDQLFSAYTTSTPGCSLGVIRDGNFVYKNSYGLASLELAAPLSSHSVFYMAKMSQDGLTEITALQVRNEYDSACRCSSAGTS